MTHTITTTRVQGRASAGESGYYALTCTCGEKWTAGSERAVETIQARHETKEAA